MSILPFINLLITAATQYLNPQFNFLIHYSVFQFTIQSFNSPFSFSIHHSFFQFIIHSSNSSFILPIHHSFFQFIIHSSNSSFILPIHHSFFQFIIHSSNSSFIHSIHHSFFNFIIITLRATVFPFIHLSLRTYKLQSSSTIHPLYIFNCPPSTLHLELSTLFNPPQQQQTTLTDLFKLLPPLIHHSSFLKASVQFPPPSYLSNLFSHLFSSLSFFF